MRTLLELASIRKTNTDFSKKVDLAILVRNREGKEVALSWGEVFYRNPASVIVATAAVPVRPHHNCKACHSHDVYGSRLAQLHRKIRFPKLVINGDSFSDRSLEDISSVRVIDLRPKVMTKSQEKLCSSRFTVTGKIKKELGWHESLKFKDGLKKTVKWYLNNRDWVSFVKSGEYREWIDSNYTKR